MDEIVKKILEEYGIAVAIVIAISSFIFTMWIKNKNTKDIKEFESELNKQKQQLEHMHQISQITYQKLFEKKINIYQNLIKIKTRYIEKYKEKGVLQEENIIDFSEIEQLHIEELNAIEDIIKDNKLFISNELLETYEKIIEEKEKFNHDFLELALTIHQNNIDDPYNEYGKDKIYTKIYKQTEPLLSKFDNILNNDILKIKKKINLD